VKPGDTVVAVRGVAVGRVGSMELSGDHQHVLVHVRLTAADSSIARHDTLFWLVRPEVSLETISALSTVISGPYIEARPGGGAPATSFQGLTQAPIATTPGINIELRAERVGQLNADSPVTYRGIQVGVVQDVRLDDEADSADVTVHIWDRYKVLVRTNSQFWMIKGADVEGSLLGGVKLHLNSLRALVSGGVAFATPEKNPGNLVTPGAQFFLSEQAKEEWLKWKPKIRIPPHAAAPHPQSPAAQPQKNMLPSLKQE
jgi:paraquat-inducible protein B